MFHFTLTTTSCHRSSAFFKALSAPHNFPGPEQFPDELTFDYHTPQDSGQPESEDNENDENSEVELETTSSSTEEPGSTSPPSFIPSLLHAPIYRPSGKWEWAANQDLEEIQSHFISGTIQLSSLTLPLISYSWSHLFRVLEGSPDWRLQDKVCL